GYRVPDTDCACVPPGTTPQSTRPISTLPVRSFTTNVKAGDVIPSGRAMVLKGIAFDGGSGIAAVAVSLDGGRTWRGAALGQDLGRFSFREWRLPVTFAAAGAAVVMVRATSTAGAVQPMEASWNPAGYMRNVVESTALSIV
ncbi:MAG: oxidase, partial [Acidobacteriota bacterium]